MCENVNKKNNRN